MSDRDHELHARKGIASLPIEILGGCFLFLPAHFLECVQILHVCRLWRSIALEFPGVWSQLRVQDASRSSHLLVDHVLSQTRHYPIDLQYYCHNWNEAAFDMWDVVEKHLHRMRTISWTADPPPNSRLIHPAPLLEEISGWLMEDIPSDLFGSVPGKLRSQHLGILVLPERCPALSTVTVLRFGTAPDPEESGYLIRLFDLFPRLESLDLDLQLRDAAFLPPGPAPHTLTRLRINTVDEHYGTVNDFNTLDLIGLCKAWRLLPRIKHLTLRSFLLDEMNFAPIVDGAIDLHVTRQQGNATNTIIVAYHDDDRQYTLEIRNRDINSDEQVVRFLLADQRCLSSLQYVRMEFDIYAVFARMVGPLPSLTELSILVHPQSISSVQNVSAAHTIDLRQPLPCSQLLHLPVLPQLATLEVSVRCDKSKYVPTVADAQALVATLAPALAAFDGRSVLLKINGFPIDVTAAVDVPSGTGYSIVFA